MKLLKTVLQNRCINIKQYCFLKHEAYWNNCWLNTFGKFYFLNLLWNIDISILKVLQSIALIILFNFVLKIKTRTTAATQLLGQRMPYSWNILIFCKLVFCGPHFGNCGLNNQLTSYRLNILSPTSFEK